ncbi:hypothetical protein PTSG_10980 [Salpingoeca rosetta]|uniref:COMM domain-containing protein n=1 Tax=Salpingoeca rosetta (strain ATCC 50818 / BSB-021) TaxID=946362 RepID=F2USC8_SALR5|nr:uncharacterized protein PTSG_10980 [Salpingoeca rosetta]EGD81037.1 hypothetical protein PTSG_10980 [Salpingoeca rosetta]|eukprot:XP_004987907.1 hypothetical protein PTSG_10980 [Salpingoeca rosetta]
MLADVPPGFAGAVTHLCGLEQETIAILAHESINHLTHEVESPLDFNALTQKANGVESVAQDIDRITAVVRALVLIYKEAAIARVEIDNFGPALRAVSGTSWTSAAIKALKAVWKERAAEAAKALSVTNALSIGKVVDVDWKLAVTTSSRASEAISRVYATLQLTIARPSGDRQLVCFDVSPAQLKDTIKAVGDISAAMDTAV